VQIAKLLEWKEANHIELCRIKNVLDEILHMYRNSELNEILEHLIGPTWVATGLEIDFKTLVSPKTMIFFLSLCLYANKGSYSSQPLRWASRKNYEAFVELENIYLKLCPLQIFKVPLIYLD
jgi:hypothetical protein